MVDEGIVPETGIVPKNESLPLVDARNRALPLSELILPPEEARAQALAAGQLWLVSVRETAVFGQCNIYGPGTSPRHEWPGTRRMEIIGSLAEVRRHAVGLFTETCPEIIIR